MSIGRIAEIHRYPVKSMQGERLPEIRIGEDGLRGDRIWATRDEGRGEIEGARRLPALLECHARFAEQVPESGDLPIPEIALPDGKTLRADDPDAAKQLSALTGRDLTLWPRRPADDTEHYKRGTPDNADMITELRDIFGRLEDEPLPDLGAFPVETLTSATLPGSYFDCYPLFLLSRTSLASMQAARPESQFDSRRFRPNLLLELDEQAGYPENEWVGKRVKLGEVVLDVAMECPRCVMTTHAFADLPKDAGVMRTLVKENGGNIGVYASVVEAGVVREGDGVEVVAG